MKKKADLHLLFSSFFNHDTAGICSTIIQVGELEFEKANYWPPDNSYPDNSFAYNSQTDFL